MFWNIVNVFFSLFLLFGILFLTLFLVKKYNINFQSKLSSGVKINVITTRAIMPKKYISVVQIENKLLLLGIAENSINLLTELDYSLLQNIQASSGINGENGLNFADLLNKFTKKND